MDCARIGDSLVDVKGGEVENGDVAERRSSLALRATADRHDRGDQATGGGEEGGGGKEESRGAGVCSEVQIETLPADQQEPARKEWETSPAPVQPPRTMALPAARMSVV